MIKNFLGYPLFFSCGTHLVEPIVISHPISRRHLGGGVDVFRLAKLNGAGADECLSHMTAHA